MINFEICGRCDLCNEFQPSKLDNEGRISTIPSVECELEGLLLPDSILPDECPYILEQTLLEDKAFNDYETLKEEVQSRYGHDTDV